MKGAPEANWEGASGSCGEQWNDNVTNRARAEVLAILDAGVSDGPA